MGVSHHPDHTHGSSGPTERRFNPHELFGDNVDLEMIESPSRNTSNFIHVGCHLYPPCPLCRRYPAHFNTLIIAVDGACRNNGHAGARSGVGVFVAPDSPYNVSHILIDNKTNQTAEIQAGIMGLMVAQSLQSVFQVSVGGLSQVVIKADSEYFVKGMTEWIPKWERNGYKTAKGQPVVNQELFRSAMSWVKKLEGSGTTVQFWHVYREMNKDADWLANLALDS